MDNLYQVHHHEQRITVLLDLGALVAVPGIFDRQIVQPDSSCILSSSASVASRNATQIKQSGRLRYSLISSMDGSASLTPFW